MCQSHEESGQYARPAYSDPFPWHLGAFDAHCHPTDTIASTASITGMRTRALIIMATRSQDQHLVSQVSNELGVPSSESLANQASTADGQVIPAFGWHPWFSHQLYDDSASSPTYPSDEADGPEERKQKHYSAVLAPSTITPDFLASLPTPTPISQFISSTRSFLQSHPSALVGEIGLDKAFRIPRGWEDSDAASRDETLTPGGREGRLLSPHRVSMNHQQAVLRAQLRLAGEMGRAVSVHGVQAHGVLLSTVSACWKGHEREVISRRQQRLVAPGAEVDSDEESDDEAGSSRKKKKETAEWSKPFPPRICLHSFSAAPEVLTQWLHPSIPADIFFSFSEAVNLSTETASAKSIHVIREVPDDRLLVESDLHVAGEQMDAALEAMYRKVCEIKGWSLEDGVVRIRKNFEAFVFG
ncbi:unnamed protein product [Clonostachys solani]|uniref:Cut9-interacting protein scn1 n=1 Tax=Clonostachys solani TaxID=160281 RepID=A0A9N9ZPZ4_9HYPO|nr:unnamed protein product [Clonostachys solani]